MIAVLSPSKTMNFDPTEYDKYTIPQYEDEAWQLAKKLKRQSKTELKDLMSISDSLTTLNYERYKAFDESHELNKNAKQAILAYRGDVFVGVDADTLSKEELKRSQEKLRILSGLYGLLRPFDLIQAYRLEMGIPLHIQRNKNLYDFWGNSLSLALNDALNEQGNPVLVNLASNEYFKALKPGLIDAPVLKAKFREFRDGKEKFISFNAKKARGMMARYIVVENIKKKEDLRGFNYDGYSYVAEKSNEDMYYFVK